MGWDILSRPVYDLASEAAGVLCRVVCSVVGYSVDWLIGKGR